MAKKPKPKPKPAAKKKPVPKSKPQGLVWNERTVAVKDLQPYEQNPRRMKEADFEKLVKHLQEDGYHQRVLATHDLLIVGGHQRIKAFQKLGITEVKVLVPNRKLTLKEFERILIRDNLPYGEFDFDMLANQFEREELIDIGMPEAWLPGAPIESDKEEAEPEEDEEVKPQVICCPKCKHQFSIMTKDDND